jgi:hypothetical protein
MFKGWTTDARELYVRYREEIAKPGWTGERIILQDFCAMRKARLVNPLQDEIEELFTREAAVDLT